MNPIYDIKGIFYTMADAVPVMFEAGGGPAIVRHDLIDFRIERNMVNPVVLESDYALSDTRGSRLVQNGWRLCKSAPYSADSFCFYLRPLRPGDTWYVERTIDSWKIWAPCAEPDFPLWQNFQGIWIRWRPGDTWINPVETDPAAVEIHENDKALYVHRYGRPV